MGISSFPIPSSGIPSGNTAGRPGSPVIGDTYYDGTLGFLLIFDGTNFIPCSAPASAPTIAVADVGTSIAYGAAQGLVTFTPGTSGGKAEGFTVSSSTGGYSATTSGTTTNITVGNNGSWTFSGTAFNGFGTSPVGASVTQTLTTVPQAPTIGTATASTSASEVTVTWTLGNNGGKNLSAITITPYLNGTTAQTAATAATTSSTSHTFSTLTPGSSYTFKVSATNANGIGLESSASNSATVAVIVTVDYLVVAGGGGSTGNPSSSTGHGGGGAGGLRCTVTATGGGGSLETALGVAGSTNYTVTVGAGGSVNTAGSDSVFSNITSTGGGRNAGGAGGNGGSGAGGSSSLNSGPFAAGNGTANQGFAGGGANANNASGAMAGGGGGAGNAGSTPVSQDNNSAGFGGNGVATNINGSSVTYAGGGGGGIFSNTSNVIPTGGTGGGGEGGHTNQSNPTSGSINTGGGAGGPMTNRATGQTGGSGIVILRYSDANTITIGAGLTGTTSAASGGYKRTTLTAGTGNVSWA
jgi:hypothetical protein